MELTLIGAEDVRETVQPEESMMQEEIVITEGGTEFQVDGCVKEVLEDVHDLIKGGIDVHGFKGYAFMHPREDYEVTYLVKGNVVIMVDYHGTNSIKVDVLGKEGAELFINNVKEIFGEQELGN